MWKNKPMLTVAGIVALGILIAALVSPPSDSRIIPTGDSATFKVQQGPLTISVIESGTIQARERVIIKNEVEGMTSILSLVDEGKRVKKGDLLIELDASAKIDQKLNFEIQVQNANASFIQARENLAVVQNQVKSDLDISELNFAFAKQDLRKYTEGEYPNELKAAESDITLARAELLRSEEKLEWSKQLYGENYLSQTELQQDELTANRDKLE
ncbi:MAG: efflux transporter periplasmic adaptor subunit, partial [Desulfobacterales bacterium]